MASKALVLGGGGVDKMKLRDMAIFGWAVLRYPDPGRPDRRGGLTGPGRGGGHRP